VHVSDLARSAPQCLCRCRRGLGPGGAFTVAGVPRGPKVGGVVSKLAAVVVGGLVAGEVVRIGTVVVVATGAVGATIACGIVTCVVVVVVVLSVVDGSVGVDVPRAAACRVDVCGPARARLLLITNSAAPIANTRPASATHRSDACLPGKRRSVATSTRLRTRRHRLQPPRGVPLVTNGYNLAVVENEIRAAVAARRSGDVVTAQALADKLDLDPRLVGVWLDLLVAEGQVIPEHRVVSEAARAKPVVQYRIPFERAL